MDRQEIVDLRARVLAGEPVSDEELAEAIKALAERRRTATNKSATKRKAVDLTGGKANHGNA